MFGQTIGLGPRSQFHEKTKRGKKERTLWWEREKRAKSLQGPPLPDPLAPFPSPPPPLHPTLCKEPELPNGAAKNLAKLGVARWARLWVTACAPARANNFTSVVHWSFVRDMPSQCGGVPVHFAQTTTRRVGTLHPCHSLCLGLRSAVRGSKPAFWAADDSAAAPRSG